MPRASFGDTLRGAARGGPHPEEPVDLDEAVRPCWMEIDLGALAHNARVLRGRLGPDSNSDVA